LTAPRDCNSLDPCWLWVPPSIPGKAAIKAAAKANTILCGVSFLDRDATTWLGSPKEFASKAKLPRTCAGNVPPSEAPDAAVVADVSVEISSEIEVPCLSEVLRGFTPDPIPLLGSEDTDLCVESRVSWSARDGVAS